MEPITSFLPNITIKSSTLKQKKPFDAIKAVYPAYVMLSTEDLFGAIGYGENLQEAIRSLTSEIEACYEDYVVHSEENESKQADRWTANLKEYFDPA